MNKNTFRCSILCLALLSLCGCERREGLDTMVTGFKATESRIDFGIGGATMWEAVEKLRVEYKIPINFESIAYDPVKDSLSMSEALGALKKLKDAKRLSPSDKLRLEKLEEEHGMISRIRELKHRETFGTETPTERFQAVPKKPKVEPLSESEKQYLVRFEKFYDFSKSPEETVVGMKKGTFKLEVQESTLRALLDQLVSLDTRYRWENLGTEKTPVIVIRPHAASEVEQRDNVRFHSKLTWVTPKYCDSKPMLEEIFSEGGVFEKESKNQGITRELDQKVYPGAPKALITRLPRKRIDLCLENQTALSILGKAVELAGPNFYWSSWGPLTERKIAFQTTQKD